MNAVPVTTTVPADGLVGLLTATLATVVSSATLVPRSVIRTTSPTRMFGVWVPAMKQPPPGWLTSATPASSTVTGSDWPTSAPLRRTLKTTLRPGVYPSAEMKSRDGKAINECGPTGADTLLAAGSRDWAGGTGVWGIVLVPCSGAVHGASGPPTTSAPFSKIVSSTPAVGVAARARGRATRRR